MNATSTDTGTRWKLILAALVIFFIGAQVLTMVFAGRRVGRVVDPDYYKNGQKYGESLRRSKADRPDWTMTAGIKTDRIQISVRDRSGVPVSGGSARLELAGTPVAAVQLTEAGPGMYQASHSFAGSELRGTFHISKGEAVYTDKLVLFR